MIYEKFCGRIPDIKEQKIIHETDDLVLKAEGQFITNTLNQWAGNSISVYIDTLANTPEHIETEFLIAYNKFF
jgi:hypothetical protein